ncbi:MAG: flagellar assembly protein FliX [Alphaproteobacteria bacterium]|nr:flagellar assembly protein FliX [Alphaproteobacteria bacterium]
MIDKIDGLGKIRTSQTIKRVARPSSSGGVSFAEELGESEETSAPSTVASSAGVSGILGLQEVDDALARASKGKLRAEDILDRLDDLRLDLLDGGVSRDKLLQLAHVVQTRRAQVQDPRLAEILDEIDLRAQVELAKHAPL